MTSTISARSRIRLMISSGINPRSTLPPDPTELSLEPLKVTERSMSCQKISQLTRRPGHRATAQHVHMQMEDRLAALPAGVGHHPIACFGDPLFLRYKGRRLQEMSLQGPIFRVVQAGDMPRGNHQHVNRRFRVADVERE